ncbi:c-type cytochrome [soil metagenome]
MLRFDGLKLLILLGAFGGLSVLADEEDPRTPFVPAIEPASDEAVRALSRFRVPEGFRVELFAAEPLLANPVAFTQDDQGRLYVAETFRLHQGVTDTRGHMYWLEDDLASRTVEDRVEMYRKHLGDQFSEYGVAEDRVRRIEDSTGDGKADRSTVFADGFNDVAAGIGSGVLARGNTVWYACIPDLWKLQDTTGDGVADVRERLHHGYGVHVGFLGHDLHGLIFGPDGKLYFTIGDRGFNVLTKERNRLAVIDTGSVLRCNPDGSNLEVFAVGLRNPQELAFDQYGNLFTVDNNSDSGDQCRLVDLVEGGDSGWQIGYQFITRPTLRGAFNLERLWRPESEGNEAASLLPPLANFSDGPSGICYDPGTGMPERYRDRFFLADFRGTAGNSGIRAFGVEPAGATFKPIDQHEFLWSVLATDVDVALNGGRYRTDWVEGWGQPMRGRIYRLIDPELDDPSTRGEIRSLLGEGFEHRSNDELLELLRHPDMRVRQRAQFALADRGAEAIDTLSRAAEDENVLTRLHGVWGLGQVGRSEEGALEIVVGKLNDPDAHVRGQAAKVLGDTGRAEAVDRLIVLLKDEAPRVRLYAAIALGKIRESRAFEPIVEMLLENADKDAYLRHAGVMGLIGTGGVERLAAIGGDESPSVRLGALLALRRLGSVEVARFLDDPEPRIVLEAARAINDVPIEEAMPALAALKTDPEMPEPLLRRIVNANFRVGGPEQAGAVAELARSARVPERVRIEALDRLAEWADPPALDAIMGLHRPLEARPVGLAAEALRPVLGAILSEAPDSVRQTAARAVGTLAIREASADLLALFADTDRTADARVEAIKALEAMEDAGLADVVKRAAADREPEIRAEGLRLLVRLAPEQALPVLDAAIQRGSTAERQRAFAALAELDSEEADRFLANWLDKLLADEVPAELRLDLLESAGKRSAAELREKIAAYEAARPEGDPLAPYREALQGGNVRAGRQIFFERTEAQCLRCHKVGGEGGEVGPDLTTIGAQKDREYLLESLVLPDAQVAEGFETLVVATVDGEVLSGVFKDDSGDTLELMTAEGNLLSIPKPEIEEQARGVSAMPQDLIKTLSMRDLRDLVEYLSSLK